MKGSSLAWTLVVVLFILLLLTEAVAFYLLGKHNYLNFKEANVEVVLDSTSAPSPTTSSENNRKFLNKEYSFPVNDALNNQIGEIKYSLTEYYLTDEIIVKGQKAKAIEGRVFLIINILLANNFDHTIEIDTRDYLRLSINNEDKWFTADIHNDPVEVQANSTKHTRLGFPIKDSDSDFRIQVGELDNTKDTIKID